MYKRILLVAGLTAVLTTTALAAVAPAQSSNSGFFSSFTVWLAGGINFPGKIYEQSNSTDNTLSIKYKDAFILDAGVAVPMLYSRRFGALSLQAGYS